MRFRIIITATALVTTIIGIRCLLDYLHSPRRAAVGIAMELASKMSKPSGGPFELINTSFLNSYDKDAFYVVLEFESHEIPEKLQDVFFFDAVGHPPQMQWNYSVFNNLAKLNVSKETFCDDGKSQIQRKNRVFEMPIVFSPVEWNIHGETIQRLAQHGVEMLIFIEAHPELKPFRIAGLTDSGGCLAEFSSREDALDCAKILDIRIKK
jgi:hypothetical protein